MGSTTRFQLRQPPTVRAREAPSWHGTSRQAAAAGQVMERATEGISAAEQQPVGLLQLTTSRCWCFLSFIHFALRGQVRQPGFGITADDLFTRYVMWVGACVAVQLVICIVCSVSAAVGYPFCYVSASHPSY